MRLLTHPPDTHQFVGLLLGFFGIGIGLLTYLTGVHLLETQYGGGILDNERILLGIVSGGIALSIVAIAYSFAKE
jgi:hypothetical protein